MKTIAMGAISATALILSGSLALAGGHCQTCYQKVVTPAQYRTVAEQVVIRPAQTVVHTTPAEYGTVHEQVVIRPAHTIAREIPAQLGQVAEKVMVSPARKEWQVTRDAHGREIGCWVKIPAQYAIQHRTVVIRPAQVVHETVPAVVETRARQVMVRPPQTRHEVIPAEYGVRHRTEMVAPPQAHWAPVGPAHHGHRHSVSKAF